MNDPVAPIDPARLSQALADINRYVAGPEDLHAALKQFHSLAEYAPGDERGCTWQAALDNCEQLKGFLSASAPESARENLDEIEAEIRRIENEETPPVWRVLANPNLIVGVLVIAGALLALSQCVPRR